MDTNQQNNIFAPPQKNELSGDAGMFAPPRQDELFAPPKPSELKQAPKPEDTPPPEMLKDEDFQRIGQKHGVSPEELRSLAPYYGAINAPRSLGEAVAQGAKGAAGFAGRSLGFNVPQKIYAKLQDPNMEQALDELQSIGHKQSGILNTVGEMVANPVAGVGSSAAARIASTAGIGAAQGFGASSKGEELPETLKGAAIGGALGAGAEVIGKLAAKYRPNKIEETLFENQAASRQFDLSKGIDEVAQREAGSEKLLNEIGFNGKNELTPTEIDVLINEQLGEKAVQKYLDPASPEGQVIREQIGTMTVPEQAIKNKLAEEVVTLRARDFAEDLLGSRPKTFEDSMREIEEFASRQGSEAVRNKYQDFLRMKQGEKYIEEAGLKAINEPNFFGRAGTFISDAQFVMRNIDDKFGTKLEEIIRDLNKDYNRSTFALREFRNKYDDVFQSARKLGTDDVVTGTDRIYQAMDKGLTNQLPEAEKATADSFKKYFDDIREFANGLVREKDPRISPLAIPQRENYVPHMLKATPDLVPVMEKKWKDSIEEATQLLGRKIDDLSQLSSEELKSILASSPSTKDLVKGVTLMDNKEIKSGADLSSRLKEMLYTRKGNISLESKARAAIAREGEIPYYMRETNLYKLARRYTDNTLRHLYLRNGLDKLGYEASTLKKAGAEVDAEYVNNIIRDVLGVRKGTAAEAMLQTKVGLARNLDTIIDKYGKDSTVGGAITTAKAFPEYLQFWLRQIYPNALGFFNLRAVLQNGTAAITKLAPELGGSYGYSSVLRGALYTVKNLPRLLAKVESLGNVPSEFTRKGEQAIAEGIARSSGVRMSRDAIEGAGKAGMFLYQKIEEFNRALTLGIGEMMAHDIAAGSPAAIGALKKLPFTVRKAVLSNRENTELTGELLGKYLNDATQYNYNKISMSEFGRTMGPFFSTFSKWPTATVGDILYEKRARGLLGSIPRTAEKYILPFMLLQAVDYAAGERLGEKDGLSDRQKKLMGSGGMSQSAPIGSAMSIARGEIFTPPAVDALYKGLVEPIMKGQLDAEPRDMPEKVAKVGAGVTGTLIQSFFPGAGLVRFITDDLVTYITGNKPEGSNYFEKTAEGARQITK